MAQRTTPGTHRLRVAAVLVAAAFVLAACGGGSKPSAAGTTTPPVQTSTASSAPVATSPSASSNPVSNSGDPFCQSGKKQSSEAAATVNAYTGDTPAELEAFEKKELAIVTAFVAAAPSQIKSAVAVVAAADQHFFNQLQAAKFNFRALSPAALAKLNTPAFEQANKTILDYLKARCGITP